MATITIRNLDDDVETRLRVRAAGHHRSMEEETRIILRGRACQSRGVDSPRAMSVRHPPTTTLSTRGRITLPRPIRDALGWDAGARLAIELSSDGVLLKRASSFAETDPEEVFGCLPFDGAPKSLAEMEAGVMAEARRRRAGG